VSKSKDQIFKENAEEHGKLVRAYLKLYQEEWGKIVLADLERYCGQFMSSVCEQMPNNDQTNYNEGKRRVWLRIASLITEGKNVG